MGLLTKVSNKVNLFDILGKWTRRNHNRDVQEGEETRVGS
jgi:hypothetical protein